MDTVVLWVAECYSGNATGRCLYAVRVMPVFAVATTRADGVLVTTSALRIYLDKLIAQGEVVSRRGEDVLRAADKCLGVHKNNQGKIWTANDRDLVPQFCQKLRPAM